MMDVILQDVSSDNLAIESLVDNNQTIYSKHNSRGADTCNIFMIWLK